MIFRCPRCEVGGMDSDKGREDSCWFCSNHRPVYVCDDGRCGVKLCQPCFQKVLDGKAKPKPKFKFSPGAESEGEV